MKQDLQEKEGSPHRMPCLQGTLFRSFRTYMSIETHVGPFSRSARTLIQQQPSEQRHIKDLKDLRGLLILPIYRH